MRRHKTRLRWRGVSTLIGIALIYCCLFAPVIRLAADPSDSAATLFTGLRPYVNSRSPCAELREQAIDRLLFERQSGWRAPDTGDPLAVILGTGCSEPLLSGPPAELNAPTAAAVDTDQDQKPPAGKIPGPETKASKPTWRDRLGMPALATLLLIVAVLLVLAWRFLPRGHSWRSIMGQENPVDARLRELERKLNRKADSADIQISVEQIFDQFIQTKLEPLIQTLIDKLMVRNPDELRQGSHVVRSDRGSSAHRARAAERPRDPGDGPPNWWRSDGPASQERPRTAQEVCRLYDRAIRERGTAKEFTELLDVVGLVKLDNLSAAGHAVLVRATETDSEKWPFWSVTADKGVAILPGRYQFVHASALASDSGRAGDRLFGQVFKIIDGADFSLQEVAKARAVDGGFEVFQEGQLELPRSRG